LALKVIWFTLYTPNRAGYYILLLPFLLLSFFFLSFFPEHLPFLHTCCGLSANSECRSDVLAEILDAKISYPSTIAQLCRTISSQLRHVSTIGKNCKQQYLIHTSSQYGEIRPTNGWDRLVSLDYPQQISTGFASWLRYWTDRSHLCCVCVCVCVCLSVCPRPHAHLTARSNPDVTWEGVGMSPSCHYLADLQSVHGLRCYGKITRTRNVGEYMLVLALCLVCLLLVVLVIMRCKKQSWSQDIFWETDICQDRCVNTPDEPRH